jgi:hypothetical protein
VRARCEGGPRRDLQGGALPAGRREREREAPGPVALACCMVTVRCGKLPSQQGGLDMVKSPPPHKPSGAIPFLPAAGRAEPTGLLAPSLYWWVWEWGG